MDQIIQKKICKELVNAFGGNFEQVIVGGAAFNPEVESFLKKIGFPITVGYGMTECAPIIAYSHWNKTKPFSCGTAVPNMEIRIESNDPHTIPGEIQVRERMCLWGIIRMRSLQRIRLLRMVGSRLGIWV